MAKMTREELAIMIVQAEHEGWTELDLSNQDYVFLPPSAGFLTNLKVLNLAHNNLGVVPNWLRGLTQLQTLRLRNNEIKVLPDWLCELTQLLILDLGDNKLEFIPYFLGLSSLGCVDFLLKNT